jgi:hypothetical protein
MSEIPESMKSELAAWNNGDGSSLDGWTAHSGNFKLAVGYLSIFWPEFVLMEDYIFRHGVTVESLRAWEESCKGNKESVEGMVNHMHIADIQDDSEDLSEDKILIIGRTLKQMWYTKLKWQFPDRPCVVEFYEPDDRKDLVQFQLSFWQKKHEQTI